MADLIDKIAWIHLEERRLLVARNAGRERFYLPGGKREPGESDVQTLVLSGTDDPVTPQRYGDQVMKGLRNGKHLVAAGQGHGQFATGCIPRLMTDFIAAGTTTDLDDACVRSIGPAPFMLSRSATAP